MGTDSTANPSVSVTLGMIMTTTLYEDFLASLLVTLAATTHLIREAIALMLEHGALLTSWDPSHQLP